MEPAVVVQKRSHIKSRGGCAECKKRKVKCDESPNGCSACFRRRTTCSLTSPSPTPRPQASITTPVSNLLDLELLHNWSTKTCLSMTEDTNVSHFYQTDFITEALRCDYVLHCLLGLSAFHLVQQHQELLKTAPEQGQPAIRAKIEEYLFAAQVHHNAGISSFRYNLLAITEENCHALFAGATLIVMTSFAETCEDVRSITDSKSPPNPEDSWPTVTKWLILLRGTKTLVVEAFQWVKTGPMGPIIARRGLEGYENNIGALDPEVALYLDRLSSVFKEHSRPEVSQVCIEAIDLLRKSWVGIASGCDFGVAFYWAVLVDEKFMALLEMKTPEALLVLGAYCMLLYSGNWRWWMKGWPKHVLTIIMGFIDERWNFWLHWPWQVVGNDHLGQWKDQVLVVTEGLCCQ